MSMELGRPADQREPVMPAVLALVRHGYSEGQAAAALEKSGDLSAFTPGFRATPSSEWNLTREGVRQARQTAEWITDHVVDSTILPQPQFDQGFFSPHTRARQTMGVMLHAGLVEAAQPNDRLDPLYRANHDIRLREIDFGEVSTIPRAEFHEQYPESVLARKIDPIYGRTPGGESIADVMDRARSFLGALARAHSRGINSALVVSHGRQIRATQLALEGIASSDWKEYDANNEIKNCQTVLYSRRDPETGEELPTFGWTSSTCPPELSPEANREPVWRRFSAPTASSAEACLEGIPAEWLIEPLE